MQKVQFAVPANSTGPDRQSCAPRASLAELVELPLDRASSVPLFRQIYLGLRDAIMGGRLQPGARLLSTRALAASLAVSRNTVTQAYEQLFAEGYVDGLIGSGTFVADVVAGPIEGAAVPDGSRHEAEPDALSRLGEETRRWWPSLPHFDRMPFSLTACTADPRSIDVLRRIGQRQLARLGATHASYGHPQGLRVLREQIARYLRAARAVRCTADEIIVVGGAQQAIDLSLRVLVGPGARVWLEDPGYEPIRAAVECIGGTVFPVPVDQDGIDVASGASSCPDARVAFVTPSHQYPMGVTMSLHRRLDLLRWAREAGAWIIEDDFDSEFRYEGRPLASLQGLDEAGRVIYVGTFSKVLLPGLRVGYLVVPPQLLSAFLGARYLADGSPPMLGQLLVNGFLAEGHLTGHIRRMRKVYRDARDHLCGLIDASLRDRLDVRAPAQGMQLVARLRDRGLCDVEVSERARQAGVIVKPVSPMSVRRTDMRGLMLGFTGFSDTELALGVSKLAKLLAP